jgi:hypothetical protein
MLPSSAPPPRLFHQSRRCGVAVHQAASRLPNEAAVLPLLASVTAAAARSRSHIVHAVVFFLPNFQECYPSCTVGDFRQGVVLQK